MAGLLKVALLSCVCVTSCGSPRAARLRESDSAALPVSRTEEPALAKPIAKPEAQEPDGDDEPEDPGSGVAPARGHFERVGRPPLALQRICDLTAFGDALYAAHANQPLGTDGATVTRYRPSDADRPFRVAFDWNRTGEPTRGGGAGQGFLRVHRIEGRLFVPDADPPYLGFWLSRTNTEGYVFVSSPTGEFARARNPGHLPPASPDPEGKPGAGVLPGAYHVLDVATYRGQLYASTGSIPTNAGSNLAAGALHRRSPDWSRWPYEIGYPATGSGVFRLTFLVRFRGRLYAGIQDMSGADRHDFVYFEPKNAEAILPGDLHPVQVTEFGGSQTLRWYADRGTLYWIAWTRRGVELWATSDGDTWRLIGLPKAAGAPTDLTRFRDSLVVLCERALLRLDGLQMGTVAEIAEKRSPFELSDGYCAAPLAVFQNELYAGSQRGGALYRLLSD